VIDDVHLAPRLVHHVARETRSRPTPAAGYVLVGCRPLTLTAAALAATERHDVVLRLDGLSHAEITAGRPDLSLEQRLLRGGFPALYADPEADVAEFMRVLVADHLARELPLQLRVDSPHDFERFLRAAATRTGRLLNKAELAREVGIAGSTAAIWLDTLVEAGYDATFDEVRDRGEHGVLDTAVPSSGGLGLVDLFARSHLVHAPAGLHLDLGGIGKGRAADLVAAQLLDDGAVGVCVDLGGDLRVAGSTADGSSWTVVVDDPFHPGADLMVLGVAAGAVTTSSTLRRRWVTPQGGAHHLLDPRTGRPVASGLASVTVLAAEAAWGEVHAKAALVAGAHEGRSLIERAGLSALFVHDDGRVDEVGGFDAFVVERSTGVDEGAGRR